MDRVIPRAPLACHGFQVPVGFPSLFARPGSGRPLEILNGSVELPSADPLLTWAERPDADPFAKLFARGPETYALWIDRVGAFAVDPTTPRVVIPDGAERARVEARLWGLPAALCFMKQGDLPLHAAAIDLEGECVLLAAPGRHGKTTLATAFLSAGHRLLSEDLTCCRLGDGVPKVLPGPALLRVRRDSYERLRPAHAEVVAEDPDRVFLRLMDAARGSGEALPITRIVMLRRSDEGIRTERVDQTTAIRDLWALSFRLPRDEHQVRSFASVSALATSVPVWDLYRPLSYERLDETIAAVVDLCA